MGALGIWARASVSATGASRRASHICWTRIDIAFRPKGVGQSLSSGMFSPSVFSCFCSSGNLYGGRRLNLNL